MLENRTDHVLLAGLVEGFRRPSTVKAHSVAPRAAPVNWAATNADDAAEGVREGVGDCHGWIGERRRGREPLAAADVEADYGGDRGWAMTHG